MCQEGPICRTTQKTVYNENDVYIKSKAHNNSESESKEPVCRTGCMEKPGSEDPYLCIRCKFAVVVCSSILLTLIRTPR